MKSGGWISMLLAMVATACGGGAGDDEAVGLSGEKLYAVGSEASEACDLAIQADSHARVGVPTSAFAINTDPNRGYGWTLAQGLCVTDVSGQNTTTLSFTPVIPGCTLSLNLAEFPQPGGCTAERRVQIDFLDVPDDPAHPTFAYHPYIDNIAGNGVSGGCGAGNFCPTAATTRDQMAVFLLRSKEGSSYVPPPCSNGTRRFSDVPGTSPFCPWIEELAKRQITSGCSATEYCPSATTTREQMAVFLLRARFGPSYVPPACTPGQERFADVPAASPYCRFVEDLARRNISAGCGGDAYCPSAPVLRQEMAVFLVRTFDLRFP